MRQGTKRSLALLLCLVLLGTLLPALPAQAEEIEIIPIEAPIEAEPVGEEEIVLIGEAPAEPTGTKPTITTQPASVTKTVGDTAKFKVVASGATTYQWYWRKDSSASWSKSTLSGNATATLSVEAKTSRDGYQYRCKVSNSSGYVYTSAATLTVTAKPVITTQPTSVTKTAGETAKFTVKASGATAYQWYWRKNSSASWAKSTLSGNTSATLSVEAKTSRNGYQYRCRVSNASGYVYSSAATLTVTAKPVITTQPKSKTLSEGATAKFSVKATGATAYQWYYRTSSAGSWHKSTLSTATKATLSLTAKTSRNGYQYRCKVSNSSGCVYTKAATLTVVSKPVITTQPQNVTVDAGKDAIFTVKGTGAQNYQWYWRKNSSSAWSVCSVAGATTARLGYGTVSYAMNGYQYRCRLTNSAGSVFTDVVTLTVRLGLPRIETQPADLTVSSGEDAVFTVKAYEADSYQWYWRKNSSSAWSVCSVAGATTARLGYGTVSLAMSGYQYRCRLTNSVGSVYTNPVTLTVMEGLPRIQTQPTDLTVNEGETMRISVKAYEVDSYQWYWRKNSSSAWAECTVASAKTATLNYAGTSYQKDGYQYYCRLTNSKGSVTTAAVTLSVNPVTYRALLVGEVNFNDGEVRESNRGSVTQMETLLADARGPMGRKYTVTSKFDLDNAGLKQAIRDVFAGADENDVSLFFIQTHGATSFASGENAGRMVLIGKTEKEYITLEELADCLDDVPGTVIVLLGSCGSGAGLVENGSGDPDEAAVRFNEAAISAFAAADRERAVSNTGELRNSKFYVMTAAAHQEMGWSNVPHYSYFSFYIAEGAGSGKPADTSGDGTVTLSELYSYVYQKILDEAPFYWSVTGQYYYQHAQIYPENSSYALFK